ncbi:unnamed protein product [Plutella xylostella]|uniref:Dynactin subunit 5 n=1 Tax=Plutella xylostella TaxID=51655 RepID=A0A8S4FE56_PLUXY|nr:unnamed protein product [Plutella xylostella]
MELQDIYYNKQEYVETASGNKVSRQTVLCGSQNIVLHGKVIVQSDAIIRGDLANVKTGRFCIISKKSVIRPPFKKFSKGVAFFPLQMGDHVFIGENTVVNAAVVGSYVYIGKKCSNWKTVYPERLLYDRRQLSAACRDCCTIICKILGQSSTPHHNLTRSHARPHDRVHKELLPTFPSYNT